MRALERSQRLVAPPERVEQKPDRGERPGGVDRVALALAQLQRAPVVIERCLQRPTRRLDVAEDLLSGERELCTRGRFTMIALDARGRPAAVPRLAETTLDNTP